MSRMKPAALALAFSAFAAQANAQEASLPGGAANLREAHGDWIVACVLVAQTDGRKQKRCALSQEQFQQQPRQQGRQRTLAIELRPEGGGVKGTLVLPFGLALDKGIAYQLDEGQAGTPQRFRTCLPVGCLMDVSFDARTIASFKSGKVLKAKAVADNGQATAFSIPLSGFAGAYERVVALLK